jgi:putative serine protease PepD
MTTSTRSEPTTSTPKPPRRGHSGSVVLLIAAALFVGAISGVAVTNLLSNELPPVVMAGQPVAEAGAPADQPVAELNTFDPAAIGASVIPSVVTVQVGATQDGQFVAAASGSGVVYDTSHILTNNHVVEAGTAVQVLLFDGRVYPAEVVGTDAVTDVAVLSVDAPDLVPLALGSTKDLVVGVPAIAVGSPLGLEGGPSLSVGVISALGREVQTTPDTVLYGMIQTDAPITNGSSGGALVDRNGDLIGITTAVGASDLGIEGIGFATPIEIVHKIADDIIADGSASHAVLGILGSTAFEPIDHDGVAPLGVTVEEVTPGSVADLAGITAGDVITAADGQTVHTMDELITILRLYDAGDPVTLDFAHAPSVTVHLGAR